MCSRYNAYLVVDEAHAVGVSGRGRGMVQELGLQDEVFARVVTFGKALGCHGAAVLGHIKLRDYLVNFARSFIFTTGLPPHALATVLAAYNQLAGDVSAQNGLREIIGFFSSEAERLGLGCFINSTSAIHCAVVPGTIKVKAISTALQERGFDVRAILSPTVPAGQERLRFCLHSYNTKQQVTTVLTHFRELLHQ
ncbi:hypothetical protein CHU92_11910 [Flavobacterium cyanobacteriorum]|uniref:Aminotransferase class I/classII large domain-containing protein n=1 Tax=Flavobacterium cyanobacteriorum TaxID=2022802 RepID=A0A255YZ45_9FLAO|nr:hypothetical protein CHU92_11910 [Flavobacterium cyanobacteriorum]